MVRDRTELTLFQAGTVPETVPVRSLYFWVKSKINLLRVCHISSRLVGWVEFNVPFQHKYGYIRDEKSGVKCCPYPVKEGQQYINLNPGRLFV